MNHSVWLGLAILAIFFTCLLAVVYDVDCLIEEALLDELWEDE